MRLSPEKLKEILSRNHQFSVGLMSGFTAAAASILGLSITDVFHRASPDLISICIIVPTIVGWLFVGFRVWKTEGKARHLSDLLSAPGTRMSYDGTRKKLIVEQVGTVDLGFGQKTQAIIDRAEVTMEEAELIGYAMDTGPRRMLLAPGSANSRPAAARGGNVPVNHEDSAPDESDPLSGATPVGAP